MVQPRELAAFGLNAVEAFDHPHDVNDELNKPASVGNERKNAINNISVLMFSRKSSISANESFTTAATSSFDNTAESFPAFQDEIHKKSQVAEEDVVRIKAAIVKGRSRAISNLKRGFLGVKLIDWRKSDGFDEIHRMEKPAFVEVEVEYEEDSFDIISKYSNPRRRYAPELAPATTAVVDGLTRMVFTKADIQYRKTINSLRITKLKELYFQSCNASETLGIGFIRPSRSLKELEVDLVSAGININPDPTLSELMQFKTPARSGDRLPKAEDPSEDNPFTSLYGGSLAKQKEEKAYTDEDPEVAAFRGPSQHITTRFKVHDILQNWLRDTFKAVRQEGRNWTARDVVRDVLSDTQNLINKEFELDEDTPLEREVVPNERNAGPCVVDVHHFVISFLTAWLDRCERHGW